MSLYNPVCQQCDDMGDESLGVEQVEGPVGREWACQTHLQAAEEAAGALWTRTDDVSAGERMDRAYEADRRLK